MRLAAVVLGAILGGSAGYFHGVFAGCDWLMKGSDLCGIDGLMMTGPFGCIAGGVAGWWVSGRRPPPA